MNILIIGNGGREHAIAWKLAQSANVDKIYVAQGNAGTEQVAQNVPIPAHEIEKLVTFARQNSIDLVVVGPDDALADGIVDAFTAAGIAAFGPVQQAAQIEASKSFAKQLMQEQGVPTAECKVFTVYDQAMQYVQTQQYPLYIKADGLALGKGAVACYNAKDAEATLDAMMVDRQFGAAGETVVIESYLDGPEISLHAFCDGETYRMFPACQDHKPIFAGDKGPNTGGMGTVAGLPWLSDQAELDALGEQFIAPVLKSFKDKGAPYKGVLYPGVKLTSSGPKIVEYNARFGDPETEVFMRLLGSDLASILIACVEGTLQQATVEWNKRYAVSVVLASEGYPGSGPRGVPISGIAEAEKLDDVVVFHAGTQRKNGQVVTSGGRVLNVTATGETIVEARDKAYNAVKLISFDGMQYRKDIGDKTLSLSQ